jgi:putative ABC transport system permease protein
MRSALTVLGIFIGVASVIWLLAIGEGISLQAQKQIEQLGATNIIVRSIKPNDEKNQGNRVFIISYGITRADYRRLEETIPTIKSIIPIREMRRQFSYQGRVLNGRLVGCTPVYQHVTHIQIDRGRFLSDFDFKMKKKFCVLASRTAKELFPIEDPIGKTVAIERDYYVVVGVMKKKAPTSGVGGSLAAEDYENDVYIPISTLWSRIGDRVITRRSGSIDAENIELNQITIQVDSVKNVMETAGLVTDMLKRHHKKEDFGITIPLELLNQARTTRLMFIVFMGLIAAVSLLVGGIGIMNIMLATVTERTREIGIRRAIGAKRRDIIRQFLIETVSLSIVGGVTGILGGLTCGPIISLLKKGLNYSIPEIMQQLPSFIQNVEPIIVPMSIPLAFGISVTIGVVFGIYPAMRAAAMDPIEALRHE